MSGAGQTHQSRTFPGVPSNQRLSCAPHPLPSCLNCGTPLLDLYCFPPARRTMEHYSDLIVGNPQIKFTLGLTKVSVTWCERAW